MEEELNKTSLADVVASAQEEIKKQSVSRGMDCFLEKKRS